MGFAAKNPVQVVAAHRKHLFGGGHILPPFPGGKDPEYEKQKGDQPGIADKVVYFDRRLEAKKAVKAFDFKTGDEKQNDQDGLQPVPETLVTGVKIYIL
jgi:hypothetical protein